MLRCGSLVWALDCGFATLVDVEEGYGGFVTAIPLSIVKSHTVISLNATMHPRHWTFLLFDLWYHLATFVEPRIEILRIEKWTLASVLFVLR